MIAPRRESRDAQASGSQALCHAPPPRGNSGIAPVPHAKRTPFRVAVALERSQIDVRERAGPLTDESSGLGNRYLVVFLSFSAQNFLLSNVVSELDEQPQKPQLATGLAFGRLGV
jgi:hypothetical protein